MSLPKEMRTTLLALGGAFVAVAGFAATAQDAPPDKSQDIAWMNAQQAYLAALKPEDGWHVYWRNPGDSGLPTQLSWTGLPEGAQAELAGWAADVEARAGAVEGLETLAAAVTASGN